MILRNILMVLELAVDLLAVVYIEVEQYMRYLLLRNLSLAVLNMQFRVQHYKKWSRY